MGKISRPLSVPNVLMIRFYKKAAFVIVVGLILTRIASGAPATLVLNEAFGVPIFADEFLWDDNAQDVATRLEWPEESKTSLESSFRRYPAAGELILGCRPYSNALYSVKGKASSISLVFANKGDAVVYSLWANNNPQLSRQRQSQLRKFPQQIQNDKKKLTEVLTKLFGEPLADRFGQGRETRESVKRWDWNGHAFLLASPRDEYVALRVMSTESADAGGKLRIPDSVIREVVANRIEQRANGDVILKDIPMVAQGPKGYCVPATWERVMRYMGVPADMYVLAMAGQTQAGGGTPIDAITAGARESIILSGRRVNTVSMNFKVSSVANYIDQGLPIMWDMFSTPTYNMVVDHRVALRRAISDPALWKKELAGARAAAKKLIKDYTHGHVCMIIGYNKITGEIAVSDSWGPEYAERWITSEEALAVTRAQAVMLINF